LFLQGNNFVVAFTNKRIIDLITFYKISMLVTPTRIFPKALPSQQSAELKKVIIPNKNSIAAHTIPKHIK
jgi:hypothetical protein